MKENLQSIRAEFPVTQRWIYLNHAAVSPLCRPAAQAMRRSLRDVEENGMAYSEHWSDLYKRARRLSAQLIGAHPSEIALLKNTSEGLITAAQGIRWHRGDQVLLAKGEFPSNVYPWLSLESQGVDVVWIEEREGRLWPEDFIRATTSQTRVLSISSVEFFSGQRNDIEMLGAFCKERDILFVVDAIQSLGAFPMDVASSHIDLLCADAHKWLLGPEGSALFYCSRKAMRTIQPTGLGWASVESAFDFLNYDMSLQPDARRYENGTLNTAGIAGMTGAIDFLLSQNIHAISQRILCLTHKLREGLIERGYIVRNSPLSEDQSGIVTFRHPQISALQIVDKLRSRDIISSERGDHIRLSPHFYNTEEEIDLTLDALAN